MRKRTQSGFAISAYAMRRVLLFALVGISLSSVAVAQPWFVGSPSCPCGPPPVMWVPPVVPHETLLPAPLSGPSPHVVARPASQNCNFALRATEDFANRIVCREQTQQGRVQDFILGADVFGDQTTTTTTRLDFQPCDTVAKLELQVDGRVASQTVGVTPQAQIQTLGQHQFRLTKEIEFDGSLTRTRSPAVFVSPSQRHVGAMTGFSRVPLLGQMADGIAIQQANARNPQAARITADRITQQAAPEFNQRVDTELSRLNQLLSGRVRSQLEQFRLVPKSQSLSTTDTDLLWCVTLDVPSPPPPLPLAEPGVLDGRAGGLYLHDSLVNDLLARLPLGGIGVPDAAIDRWFRVLAEGGGLAALSRSGEPIQPQLATIVFDRTRPIQLHFENGQFQLVLRIGFQTNAGPVIPTQEITIPFTVKLSAASVEFQPGEVQIAAGNPADPGGMIDEAARVLIREQVQNRLQSRTAPRRIPVELPDAPASEVSVHSITLRDGWLSVTFD